DTDDGSFAGARRWQVFAVKKNRFNYGNILEAWDAVFGKSRVENPAVFKFDCLKECAAEPHDVGSFHLITEAVRIHDGAAFERSYDADHSDSPAVFVRDDFSACCDITAFFNAATNSKSLSR